MDVFAKQPAMPPEMKCTTVGDRSEEEEGTSFAPEPADEDMVLSRKGAEI